MKKVFSILVIALFTSCATTTQITKFAGEDKLQSTSEARIYVLRPSILGSAIEMEVFCNDQLIGKTGPKSFLSWDVKEGEYIIRSKSENNAYLKVNAKAGKTYYIKQIPKLGWIVARVGLEILDENEGQEILEKLKNPELIDTE
jgi:hypothetical protein